MESEICLTCLCIPFEAHNVNEIALGNLKIIEMLHQLIPLVLKQQDFRLPHQICAKCLKKLVISYKFQKQCLNSLQNLHKLWLENSSIRVSKLKAYQSRLEAEDVEFETNKNNDEATVESLPEIEKDLKMTFDKIAIYKEDIRIFEEDYNKSRESPLNQKVDAEGTLTVTLHCNEVSNKNLQEKTNSEDVEEEESVATNRCRFCNKIFKRPQGLASHMSKTHLKKHLYQCQKCDKGFSVEEPFIRHCNRHLGIKPFQCTQCDKAFETNSILNKHLLCHSKEPSFSKEPPLWHDAEKCEKNCPKSTINQKCNDSKICAKRLRVSSPQLVHMDTEYTHRILCDMDKKHVKRDQEQSNGLNKHGSGMLKEQNCVHDNITMESLNENEEREKSSLEGILKEFKRENMEDTEVLVSDVEQINVKLDENKSGANKELRVQPKSPSDNMKEQEKKDQSTECNLCNQIFKNPQGLARHRSSTHFKKHLYQCDKCGRGFSVEDYYIKHCNRHLGIKAFKCNQCDKAFESNSILNQHLISHSKLTPHLCTTCGKSFRRIDGLRQHMKRHGEERPFKCSVCPKSFKCLSDKLKHMRIHDEKRHERYECNICGSRLATPESLSTHQMIHTGEKPFKCRHCDKSFICAINMKTHERIHTGEKPYKCQYCWKTFRQSNDRKKHTRRMHKIEQI